MDSAIITSVSVEFKDGATPLEEEVTRVSNEVTMVVFDEFIDEVMDNQGPTRGTSLCSSFTEAENSEPESERETLRGIDGKNTIVSPLYQPNCSRLTQLSQVIQNEANVILKESSVARKTPPVGGKDQQVRNHTVIQLDKQSPISHCIDKQSQVNPRFTGTNSPSPQELSDLTPKLEGSTSQCRETARFTRSTLDLELDGQGQVHGPVHHPNQSNPRFTRTESVGYPIDNEVSELNGQTVCTRFTETETIGSPIDNEVEELNGQTQTQRPLATCCKAGGPRGSRCAKGGVHQDSDAQQSPQGPMTCSSPHSWPSGQPEAIADFS